MGRGRGLSRRVNFREPKKKFTIYSEGRNTEPEYFRAVKKCFMGALVHLELIAPAGVPMTIAEKACLDVSKKSKRKKGASSFEENDEVWAVFDRDEHPKCDEAIAKCQTSGVGVAFSDPCFELWLILHHSDFDRPDDRHDVQKAFQNICCDYDPNGKKTTDCLALMPLVEEAEKRAERQMARRIEEGERPSRPFTTVYELTRRLRQADDAHRKN